MPIGFNSIALLVQCMIGIVFLLSTIFWIGMLIDCVTSQKLPTPQKVIWMVVMIFTHLLGALLYFFLGRSPKQPQIIRQPYPYMQPQPPQVPYYPYQQGYQATPPMSPPYQASPMPPPASYEQQPPLDYEQPQAMYPHEQNND